MSTTRSTRVLPPAASGALPEYWIRAVDPAFDAVTLPSARPRPEATARRRGRIDVRLDGVAAALLDRIAGDSAMLKFVVVAAATQACLFRYNGHPGMVIGTAARHGVRVRAQPHALPLALTLGSDLPFRALLEDMRTTLLAAYAAQRQSIARVTALATASSRPVRHPLFRVAIRLEELQGPLVNVGHDVEIALAGDSLGLSGTITFDDRALDVGAIERFWSHVVQAVHSGVERPDTPLDELELVAQQALSSRGRNEPLRRDELAAPAVAGGAVLAHEWFERQALQTPDAVALAADCATLTYAALNRRANQLSRYLRRLGVAPDVRVGVCLAPGIDWIVALLAVWKSGGAYVPIDPSHPPPRRALIIDEAEPHLVMTTERTVGSGSPRSVDLCKHWPEIDVECAEALPTILHPENIAYVLYTSGSSGQPKGVATTHGGLADLAAFLRSSFHPGADERILQAASPSVDLSLRECLTALLTGAHLVVCAPHASVGPELADVIRRFQITSLMSTPAVLATLPLEDSSPLQTVFVGGEACPAELAARWSRRTRLLNAYGLTEATVESALLQDDGSVSTSRIGPPRASAELLILDRRRRPVPSGVIGELYVGGPGVARGYLNRPALTAERFVPHPCSHQAGARLVRTGDLARQQGDGTTDCLGRVDGQIKLHGHRIEVGEIASILLGHDTVKEAVVITRDDEPERKRLVAYIVARASCDVAELRAHAHHRLPEYMVPSVFVVLSQMPLTAAGKVDTRALPIPDRECSSSRDEALSPPNLVERALIAIWQNVLGIERVSVTDNFFALGGDSMRSVQVAAQAKKAGLPLSVRAIFEHQTIEALAAACEQAKAATIARPSQAPFALIDDADRRQLPEDVEDAYPLSALQAGMLFHAEYSPSIPLYRDVASHHLRLDVDVERFRRVIADVVERHPVLRTSFDIGRYSKPLQLVHRHAVADVNIEDISGFANDEQNGLLRRWFEAEKQWPFDMSRPGLLRVHLHRRAADRVQFTISSPHAILDGWSAALLQTEMFRRLTAQGGADGDRQPPLASSFRDFVEAEQHTIVSAEARQYWQTELQNASMPVMPWDARQEPASTHGIRDVFVSEATSVALRRLSESVGVHTKTLALAAHVRVTGLLSGQSEVITGVTSNGRLEVEDGDQTLGLFLNVLPFRINLSGGSWHDLVNDVGSAERRLVTYRRFPLAHLRRIADGAQLFETSFNFVHFHVYRELLASGVQVLGSYGFGRTSFPLVANFSLDPVSNRLHLRLDYDSGAIDTTGIDRIAGYYASALDALAARPSDRYEMTPLISNTDARLLTTGWNDKRVEDETTLSVPTMFERQVQMTPDAIAVVHGPEQLSYQELNRKANSVARALRGAGIKSEMRVVLSSEPSISMVIGVVGTLKAGAAYVPVDFGDAPDRVARLLRASLPTAALIDGIDSKLGRTLKISLRASSIPVAPDGDRNLDQPVHPGQAAYVIFTSGSTGDPKGVVVTHQGLANYLHWSARAYGAADQQGVPLHSSITSDLAVTALYLPLLHGNKVIFAYDRYGIDGLRKSLTDGQGATFAKLTPAHVEALSWSLRETQRGWSVRRLIIGGEALTYEQLADWRRLCPHTALINEYGPTETVVGCSVYQVRAGDPARGRVPIGRAIANTHMYVLDRQMCLSPVMVVGELSIGGAGVARGYLNQPGLTAELFVPDPFSARSGARMYRTGDRARWRSDGQLEFIGRADDQVKIRGYRVEPGEIEVVLRNHPNVRQATVLSRRRGGHVELIAYVVSQDGASLAPEHVRAYLHNHLPPYMIPAALVCLKALPLTANGKVDRKALPAPAARRREAARQVAPRSPMEQQLVDIWERCLGVRPLGIHDSFFDVGGNSLQALWAAHVITHRVGLTCSPRAIVENPTVAGLSQLLSSSAARHSRGGPQIVVPLHDRGDRARTGPPLFLVHPVGGATSCYDELAGRFGHRRLLGLQSPGLANHGSWNCESIPTLAARYLDALRDLEPNGPYHLGGWSFGGLVAFEMATQLQRQGETVASLGLIDTRFALPGANSSTQATDPAMSQDWDDVELVERVLLSDGCAVGRSLGDESRLTRLLDLIGLHHVIPERADMSVVHHLAELIRTHLRAASLYQPGKYHGRIVLFNPSERAEHSIDNVLNAAVTGGVEVCIVPGTHTSMIHGAGAEAIAGWYLHHHPSV